MPIILHLEKVPAKKLYTAPGKKGKILKDELFLKFTSTKLTTDLHYGSPSFIKEKAEWTGGELI